MLVLAVVSTAAAAGPGHRAASLRNQASALDSQAHRALLDLYALDTRLQNARAQLASLQMQAVRLRAEQLMLAQQISATRQTLHSSQTRLGDNLRRLYEQGDTNDALSVMLGARSLDEAVTTIDDISRVADQSRRVVAVTTAAQDRLARLRSTIDARRTALGSALAAARSTTDELATARSDRLGFLTSLRTQQALKSRQIAALQATAHRVEAKSQKLQAAALGAPAPAAAAAAAPVVAPVPVPSGARTLTVSSTGYSLPGHTATGMPVGWGVVAVDPSLIPLGTRLTIPGYGEAVAADTGGAVHGAMIDLWFPTLAQAQAWGRRTITITLH